MKIRAGAHPTHLARYTPSEGKQRGNGGNDALANDSPIPIRGSTLPFINQATHKRLRVISGFMWWGVRHHTYQDTLFIITNPGHPMSPHTLEVNAVVY